MTPDCAVEMNSGIGSSGEPGGAKAEANNFNIGIVLGFGMTFFWRSLKHWSLQPAISQRPIVFAPEGLPLDPCVSLNCAIRDEAMARQLKSSCFDKPIQ
jgi:hypothetical protein